MCGRARCTLNQGQVARACGLPTGGGSSAATLHLDRYRPSYNVSPGADLPVAMLQKHVTAGGDGEQKPVPVIHCMKWGLVPSFTKKTEKPDHYKMFNARCESIKEKASFRRLIPTNRCLVAVEGFYEWKKDGSKKQPYYIHFEDHRPLVFAALYDSWMNSEGEILHTFTIVTTRSSMALEWLHDRMPVILGNQDSIDMWLNSSTLKFETVLCPYEGPDLVWYPVTTAVGKPSFDGPECIKELKLTGDKSISKFFMKKPDSSDQSEKGVEKSSEFPKEHALGTLKREICGLEYDKFGSIGKTHKSEDFVPENEVEEQDNCGIKREFEEMVGFDRKAENIGCLSSPVKKKGKGARSAGDGQKSLTSYFARK